MLPMTLSLTRCAHCPQDSEEKDCRTCGKCDKTYCPEHANRVCLMFCQDCFKDVNVLIDAHFKRIDQDFSLLHNCFIEHTHTCKHIRLDGPDYVWYSTAINLLSDSEFEMQFELHKYVVKLFEVLSTTRKIEHENKVRDENRRTRSEKAAATLVSAAKPKPKVQKVKSLREILEARGIKGAVLEAMLKVGQGIAS